MLIRGLWICSLFCILVLLCLLALFCWIFAKAIFLRFVLGALGSVGNRKGESDRIFGWHFLCIFYLFRDGSWFVAFIVISRCEFDGLFECSLVKFICSKNLTCPISTNNNLIDLSQIVWRISLAHSYYLAYFIRNQLVESAIIWIIICSRKSYPQLNQSPL